MEEELYSIYDRPIRRIIKSAILSWVRGLAQMSDLDGPKRILHGNTGSKKDEINQKDIGWMEWKVTFGRWDTRIKSIGTKSR